MIRFRNLEKSFGSLCVLNKISGFFEPGTIIAIVGHNGSGKTTLMKCLLGLDRMDKGEIEINGRAVNDDPGTREIIGYMPQIARFPENLNGYELFNMIKDLRGSDAPGIPHLINHFSLEDHLEKPLKDLSGGTRQKVNACIAFMFDTEILILDEPSAGLDPVSNQLLKSLIREKKKAGKTILITSHVMSDLQEISDRLLCLIDGNIYFDGTIDQLLLTSGVPDLEKAVARLMGGGL